MGCVDSNLFMEDIMEVKMTDKESMEYQLSEWLEGRPWHNTVRDECCPDFSCCVGQIASLEFRQAFVNADPAERERLCFSTLSALLSKNTDAKIHIIQEAKDIH
jgi:hypothetical protein